MKTKSKALLLSLCAVMLVAASIFGTLAYLTDTDTVANTFTVGQVGITLDEADVNTDGTYVTDKDDRVDANEYHLMPGHEYIKDPTVHVDANSEDSWIFVKVENGLSAFEAASVDGDYQNITDQIIANGWTPLEGVDGVYYKKYVKGQEVKDLEVFAKFKIADDANDVEDWSSITAAVKNADGTVTPGSHDIVVTAYAVQKDGFTTAKAAWDATFVA